MQWSIASKSAGFSTVAIASLLFLPFLLFLVSSFFLCCWHPCSGWHPSCFFNTAVTSVILLLTSLMLLFLQLFLCYSCCCGCPYCFNVPALVGILMLLVSLVSHCSWLPCSCRRPCFCWKSLWYIDVLFQLFKNRLKKNTFSVPHKFFLLIFIMGIYCNLAK